MVPNMVATCVQACANGDKQSQPLDKLPGKKPAAKSASAVKSLCLLFHQDKDSLRARLQHQSGTEALPAEDGKDLGSEARSLEAGRTTAG